MVRRRPEIALGEKKQTVGGHDYDSYQSPPHIHTEYVSPLRKCLSCLNSFEALFDESCEQDVINALLPVLFPFYNSICMTPFEAFHPVPRI